MNLTAAPQPSPDYLTLGDRLIKKEATIFPQLRSFIDSSQASNSLPLTLKPLQRQQLQHIGPSRDAKPQLPIHLKRSPQPSAQNRSTDAVERVDALAQLPKQRSTQPVVETQSSPERSQPVSTQRDVALTLSDVVILALENNRPLKNAYLERIAQRQDLAVAEDKFVPNFTPDVSISIARFRSDGTITTTDIGIGATVAVTIPTGGELRFRWDTSSQTSDFDDFGIDAIAIDNDTFKDLNESIEIQIRDKIRDINLLFSQVGLAQKATILSQQQLDIEREKQRLGRGAGIFEIVRLQNELVDAKNAELNVTIDYLNALTRLDRTLGATLDTWQVKVDKQ